MDSEAQGWLCDWAPPLPSTTHYPRVPLQHVGLWPVSVRSVQRLLVSGRLFDLGNHKVRQYLPGEEYKNTGLAYFAHICSSCFTLQLSLSLSFREYLNLLLLETFLFFKFKISKKFRWQLKTSIIK